ncbi:hypothetical protein J5J83_19740 [Azoarcus sp. L1K30]|uniref:PBECR3 domain-containing polyvalent protein n=1 Tax=Azoarcus sp. L1K30 TaxID=2820277 RepID=UPI001B83C7B0|nr:hypothetical protein [Azoarcus sp. L1K30]MBR0568360.1 hypothetical protein [Azoarcus sp. L1K30]
MSDIYDQLLDQQPVAPAVPQLAAPSFDIYDKILDDQQALGKRALQGVLDQAVRISPEKALTVHDLAKSSGLAPQIVERNFEEVQRREQVKSMQALLSKSPILARQMMDPEFAKLAQNDVEPLTGVESVAAFFKDSGRAMVGGLYSASAGAVGITQAGADLLSQFVTKPLAGTVLPQDFGGMIARDLAAYRQGIDAEAKSWMPQASGILESGWFSGLQSLSRNVAALPLALLPGGQSAALTAMTAPVFGEEYGKARDNGMRPLPSLSYGASQAAIEYATEKIPVSRLIGDIGAGASLPKILAHQMAAEIPGEQIATVLQDLNEWAVINTDKTFGDYLAERPSAAVQTLIATVVGTAGQTTIMSGVQGVANRISGKSHQAMQAADTAQQLAELTKFSRAISLTEASPETFQQFVDAALEDGPVQDVFIDANVLMQSGIADKLAEVSPSVAEQLHEAAGTGGSVRIPVAEFAARIAPTELADGLLDHLKTDPDGMSRAEAGTYLQGMIETLQQEVSDTIDQTGEALAHRASVDTVRNTIRDELNAVNRFRPDVNEAYATLQGEFFGTLAQRIGITPDQLFEKYRLRTVAENVAGGQQFDQSALSGMISRAKSAIRTALGISKQDKRHTASYELMPVFAEEVAEAAQFGIDIAGFKHAIDGSAIRHTFKSHGNQKKESARGQVAITDADIEAIPDIIAAPDRTIYGLKNDIGRDMIVYLKTMPDGTTVYLEEVRTGRKTLTAQSMRKYPGTTSAASIEETLRPTSETLPGDGLSVVEHPAPRNAGELFQNQRAPRASFSPATNTIALLNAADLSSFLHESGHFFLEVMIDVAATAQTYDSAQLTEGERGVISDVNALMQWFGVQDLLTWQNLDFEEKRAYHEQFAESFERYLMEGDAPSIELQPAFQRFRAWLVNVYKSIKDFLTRNPSAGRLSDDVRKVFDRMLASDEAIKTAEQARSLIPLFTSAQQAGMTEDEFAAYQALGQEATATAQDELSARGVRDMQWLTGARSRALRKLQKEADALRKEVEIEARREVMSQPVYRAWQFLTSKIAQDDKLPAVPKRKSDPDVVDPSIDSLFVAIAKLGGLERAQLESEWRLSEKEKIAPPVFGKHVLRRNGGLTIGDMRAELERYGYLTGASDEKAFEDLFFDELGGTPVYSSAADFDYLAQINQRPGDQIVNPDALMAGRLDRAALRETSLTKEQRDALVSRRMTAADGLHPDIVAELFGFDSGDALVRALAAAQDPATEIESLTDLRMLERHGDLATPQAVERAADAAIHNTVRARMIATELNALSKANGDARVMTEAAKQFARQSVARLKVRNIRPSQYAAAEARAGRAAESALKEADLEKAAAEKRNQLVNVQLARSAREALDEIEKAVAYLKKFDSEGGRRNIDVDYLDQIDALLDRFDLRKGQSNKAIDKRTALASWIEARSNEGTEPDIPEWIKAEAAREHYKNLTVEQFRGVVDSVRQIEHLGRLKKTLLTARDKRELDAIVAELRDSITEAAGGRVVDNEKRNTLASRAEWVARGFMAAHRKLASIVREVDGMRDGGPLWEYLVRPMNEAGEREATMRADAAQRLHELAKPLLNDGEKMGGKGRAFPALGRSLNRGERISIALNWGNEGNRQRLLDGRNWRADQVQTVLNTLTPAEWQFVQGVWDFFESYRPQIAAKERRVAGKEPDWIEPAPFTVRMPDGQPMTVRGGYYPVKYDPAQSGEAEAHADAESAKQMMRAAYTAATTRRSFTKGRAEKVVNRPILLSFDGIYQGANEVIHDLAWHEFLIDANRLLKRLDPAMRTGFGAEKVTAIKKAIEDIARGDMPAQHQGERILNHLRTGATVTGLGWNLTTALLQPLGLSNSIVRVGPAWIARGLREFYGSPSHMAAKVEEAQAKSEFLRNRMRTMNREINDVQNRLESDKSEWRQAVDASFFIMIQKLQATVDYPTWFGAYEKAIADPASMREDGTIDEVRAVAMADQAVIDAQGGGQIKDLAQIQRGSAAWKLFTNFYSYFSTTLNLAVERTRATNFRRPREVMRLASDYALLMVVPAIAGELLRAFMKGEDDEDEIVRALIAGQISFLMGMFVGVRELTSAAQAVAGVGMPFGYQGPAGVRFFSEVQKLAQQIDQGNLDMALFKAANNTAGVLFHYPAGQVNRTVEGAVSMIEGDTSNPMSLVVGPPK